MSDLLTQHLRRLAAEPFEYGRCDCLLALADWVQLRTGTDPGAQFRGRYHTRLGWVRLVRRAGGMVSLVGYLLEEVGWSVVEPRHQQPGDVGVVTVSREVGPAGALCGAHHWYLKLHGGLVAASAPPLLRAWGPR